MNLSKLFCLFSISLFVSCAPDDQSTIQENLIEEEAVPVDLYIFSTDAIGTVHLTSLIGSNPPTKTNLKSELGVGSSHSIHYESDYLIFIDWLNREVILKDMITSTVINMSPPSSSLCDFSIDTLDHFNIAATKDKVVFELYTNGNDFQSDEELYTYTLERALNENECDKLYIESNLSFLGVVGHRFFLSAQDHVLFALRKNPNPYVLYSLNAKNNTLHTLPLVDPDNFTAFSVTTGDGKIYWFRNDNTFGVYDMQLEPISDGVYSKTIDGETIWIDKFGAKVANNRVVVNAARAIPSGFIIIPIIYDLEGQTLIGDVDKIVEMHDDILLDGGSIVDFTVDVSRQVLIYAVRYNFQRDREGSIFYFDLVENTYKEIELQVEPTKIFTL